MSDDVPDRRILLVGQLVGSGLAAEQPVHQLVRSVHRLVPADGGDVGVDHAREHVAAHVFGETRREILVSVTHGTRYRISKWT